jgi:hydrogenase large subunit
MLACENAADHLSHFYLFFLPDFTRPVYADRPWHAEALRRFAAQAGERGRAALAARQRWFTLMGTLGGKWPHTHSIQPGGSRAIEPAERLRLLSRVRELRAFLEQTLLGDTLEAFQALPDEAALQAWAAPRLHADLPFFLQIGADLGLETLGPGPGRWLSHGSFVQPDGSRVVPQGVFRRARWARWTWPPSPRTPPTPGSTKATAPRARPPRA